MNDEPTTTYMYSVFKCLLGAVEAIPPKTFSTGHPGNIYINWCRFTVSYVKLWGTRWMENNWAGEAYYLAYRWMAVPSEQFTACHPLLGMFDWTTSLKIYWMNKGSSESCVRLTLAPGYEEVDHARAARIMLTTFEAVRELDKNLSRLFPILHSSINQQRSGLWLLLYCSFFWDF